MEIFTVASMLGTWAGASLDLGLESLLILEGLIVPKGLKGMTESTLAAFLKARRTNVGRDKSPPTDISLVG